MELSGVTIKSIYQSWVRYQCAKIYSIKRGWLALPHKSEMTKNFLFIVKEVIFRGSFVLSFFSENFQMALQLMRFQSQNLSQVQSLLSDVRKSKWEVGCLVVLSCCFCPAW